MEMSSYFSRELDSNIAFSLILYLKNRDLWSQSRLVLVCRQKHSGVLFVKVKSKKSNN